MAPSPRTLASLVLLCAVARPAVSSDHADANGSQGLDLGEANITDFFAFRPAARPDDLALVVMLGAGFDDPDFAIPEDVTVRFHVDNHSEVTFTDGDPTTMRDDWTMRVGGTVTDIGGIRDDIVFVITFEPLRGGGTAARLEIEGLPAKVAKDIAVFPGPADSPLRGGRPVVAIQVPLEYVVTPDDPDAPVVDTLLLWTTVKVPEVHGHLADHQGMPGTSNQPGNLLLNTLRPQDHADHIGDFPRDLYVDYQEEEVELAPYADVLIYRLSHDAHGFPPGRGFVQFDPFDPTQFPNGRPVPEMLAAPAFPYVAE